ncbi:MAG: hypothetical protein Q9163_005007 [Psora crenata]
MAEISAPDIDKLSPEETLAADIAKLPPEEIPAADIDKLSPEEIPAADIDKLSPEEIPAADIAKLTPEEIPAADIDKLSPEEIPAADIAKLTPEEIPAVDVDRFNRKKLSDADYDRLSKQNAVELFATDVDTLTPEDVLGWRNVGQSRSADHSKWKNQYREAIEWYRSRAEKKYHSLVMMDGRPTRPIQYDAGHNVYNSRDELLEEVEDDEQKELRWIQTHWRGESSKFSSEKYAWKTFHKFQDHIRNSTPLSELQQQIDNYWQENQISEELRPQLHIDQHQQSKVDEWKMYYWHQHRYLEAYEGRVKKTEQVRERQIQRIEAAPSRLVGKSTEQKLVDGEWVDREILMEYMDCDLNTAKEERGSILDRLEWIESQLPVIATECAIADQVSKG